MDYVVRCSNQLIHKYLTTYMRHVRIGTIKGNNTLDSDYSIIGFQAKQWK